MPNDAKPPEPIVLVTAEELLKCWKDAFQDVPADLNVTWDHWADATKRLNGLLLPRFEQAMEIAWRDGHKCGLRDATHGFTGPLPDLHALLSQLAEGWNG
jgi:hypothetical protein